MKRVMTVDFFSMICTLILANFSVINMTLPDDKSNYVHRIGRVGRAQRMGLAVSLVATCKEKVWYHGQWCSSRGKNCNNTDRCCIWQDEMSVREMFFFTVQLNNFLELYFSTWEKLRITSR